VADGSDRTPEERETARLERERRRARESGAASARPQPDPVPGLDGQDSPEPDGVHPDDVDREHDDELASGTRRVGWRERTAATLLHSRPGRASASRPAGPRRVPTRRRRIVLRTMAVLALVLGGAVFWFCVELFQPFHGSGHGRVTVTIPPRLGARRVGDLLAREGVVASGFFFYARAILGGDRGKLYAGTYHLKLDMSYSRVLEVLTTRPPPPPSPK
jgi:hypothetical protein